jgi:hypothetical protein
MRYQRSGGWQTGHDTNIIGKGNCILDERVLEGSSIFLVPAVTSIISVPSAIFMYDRWVYVCIQYDEQDNDESR